MPFEENVTVDEGVNAYGIRTRLHFEGDSLITQRTYDAEPLLEACKAERVATAGERWGEMRKVGSIPMAEYAKFLAIRDNAERQKALKAYLAANPAFVTFDRYLK